MEALSARNKHKTVNRRCPGTDRNHRRNRAVSIYLFLTKHLPKVPFEVGRGGGGGRACVLCDARSDFRKEGNWRSRANITDEMETKNLAHLWI